MSTNSKIQQRLIIHNSKVLRAFETNLYSGWESVNDIAISTAEPTYKWKGSKIPYGLWTEVVAFMRWSQKKFKAEAIVTFFYNTVENTWAVWPFPQEPMGMTVRYLETHPLYTEDRKQFGKDWIQFGSLHHHCTASAFASSTDKDDEKDRDGIHITLGKLDDKTLDVHCRQTFDSVVTLTKLIDWVENPDYLNNAPNHLIYQFTDFALRTTTESAFPEAWKERIIERKYTQSMDFTEARHQLLMPSQPTILTRVGPTTPTTTTERKEDKRSGNKHYQKAVAKLNDWEKRMVIRLDDILTRLAMSPEEAHHLLASMPNSDWEQENVILRSELVRAMNTEGIPHLYAEDILKKMQEVATCKA